MILAFDTYYFDNSAKTVCIAFGDWEEEHVLASWTETLTGIAEYIPGAFYKRELPCIMSLYSKLPPMDIEAILIDGFVYLDDNHKYGLGGYLYKELNETVPVVGVAKTNFATIEVNKEALLRGDSKRPLYITAIGMDLKKATDNIRKMHGEFRIPTLL